MRSNSDPCQTQIQQIAIFPLNVVLFPQGQLALRIFEPRYLRMVSECVQSQTGFGVCLITKGKEAGAAEVVRVGTTALISDWQQLPRNMLGIRAFGQQRFKVLSSWIEPDGLRQASVEWLPTTATVEYPAGYAPMQRFLQSWMDKTKESYTEALLQDAEWVSMRLAERLPIKLSAKQKLLEMNDPVARLEQLYWDMKQFLQP